MNTRLVKALAKEEGWVGLNSAAKFNAGVTVRRSREYLRRALSDPNQDIRQMAQRGLERLDKVQQNIDLVAARIESR